MSTEVLDRTFAALADPTRRSILARLSEGEASVGELAAPFDMSAPPNQSWPSTAIAAIASGQLAVPMSPLLSYRETR